MKSRDGGSAGWPENRLTARSKEPHHAADGFAEATLSPPAARWEASIGEYILDWDDVRASADPHAFALEFARSVFRHACAVCEWDPALAASAVASPESGTRREIAPVDTGATGGGTEAGCSVWRAEQPFQRDVI